MFTTGAFAIAKEASPHMIKRGHGTIIYTSATAVSIAVQNDSERYVFERFPVITGVSGEQRAARAHNGHGRVRTQPHPRHNAILQRGDL